MGPKPRLRHIPQSVDSESWYGRNEDHHDPNHILHNRVFVLELVTF